MSDTLPAVPPVVTAVRDDHLTYLEEDALRDLHERASDIERRGLEGVFVEAGCALGGSAIVIASAKAAARPFYVYDVFGMIPPPSEKDDADVHKRYEIIRSGKSEGIGGKKYYGYEDDLLQRVIGNFRRHGLEPDEINTRFVRGLFQDTMRLDQPVALAHIDGDWYDSVMTCLTRLVPHLVPGGVLVIDDYGAWSGCRKAVDEYFADKRGQFSFEPRSRLHIVRNAS